MLHLRKDVGIEGADAGSALGLLSADAFEPWQARAGKTRGANLAERLLLTALAFDTAVAACALVLAFWMRFRTPIAMYGTPETRALSVGDYAGYFTFGVFSLISMLTYFNVYDRRRLLRYRYTGGLIMKAGAVWFFGFLFVSLMFKFQPVISRVYVVIAAGSAFVGIMGWRYVFHRFLHRSQVAKGLRQRVIFVGWNEESEKLSRSFEADDIRPYEVAGCVPSPGSQFQTTPTVPVLGDYSEMGTIFAEQQIDMVMLADVGCAKGEIVGLANLCEREMVQFKIVPSYFQILVSGLHLETVSGVPVLGVSRLPLDVPFNFLLKRLADIVGATVGLILSAPLMALFAALVYIESPGPVIYKQRRMGRNGHPFNIYKIRSMRVDAEAGKVVGWTVKDDPRRLRVGTFMRKWNIDEVPQFWNVLKGEMSLVGPRPERPELIANFKGEIPHYNARHNTKPGITGWAQIKGLRGDTDLEERIRADLYYLENWSILLDFQIMALTFRKQRNAY
jgi:exopolysaccharide biosynthesis polyprenyl glycosylphosphotransferase